MALRCSRVPVALPCDDRCVLNKHFPGRRLGNPPSLEALSCIFTGRKEFRGIYQALSTSAEVFAAQKVPFLYQKLAASAVLSQGEWIWSCHVGQMGSCVSVSP